MEPEVTIELCTRFRLNPASLPCIYKYYGWLIPARNPEKNPNSNIEVTEDCDFFSTVLKRGQRQVSQGRLRGPASTLGELVVFESVSVAKQKLKLCREVLWASSANRGEAKANQATSILDQFISDAPKSKEYIRIRAKFKFIGTSNTSKNPAGPGRSRR